MAQQRPIARAKRLGVVHLAQQQKQLEDALEASQLPLMGGIPTRRRVLRGVNIDSEQQLEPKNSDLL